MNFDNRASWRYQQPFYDPPNQPYSQDGVYRQNQKPLCNPPNQLYPQNGVNSRSQQPNREYDTYSSSSNSQGRRTNIPNNQRQQIAAQTNMIFNNVDLESFVSILVPGKSMAIISPFW